MTATALIIAFILGFLWFSFMLFLFCKTIYSKNIMDGSGDSKIAGTLFGGIVGIVIMIVAFGKLQYGLKNTIYYDSSKHNTVLTDTTFITNKGKVDTLITYLLTNKEYNETND